MAGKRFSYNEGTGAVYRQWGEHTVCKRDTREVRSKRLEIEKQTEDFLSARGELTPERRWAINQARFEMARTAWPYDREEALQIVADIHQSQPGFQPGGAAAPSHYRVFWKCLGFRGAEIIAGWFRKFRRPVAA
jgi:hypothetical protein